MAFSPPKEIFFPQLQRKEENDIMNEKIENSFSFSSILSDSELGEKENLEAIHQNDSPLNEKLLNIKVCSQNASEIKRKMINELNKLKLKTIKKKTKIVFDLVLTITNPNKSNFPKEITKTYLKSWVMLSSHMP